MADQDFLEDPSQASVLLSKFKKNPFLALGCLGFVATVGIGAYKFKTRPANMSIGSYLVQLRVIAQTMVVGSLTIGMTYGMLDQYVLNKKKH